jgi:Mn2+/Fe2+ NRAMP family transporter
MDAMVKGLIAGMVILFAFAFYTVATIPKECMNGFVYEKSSNGYWTKTNTECLPISKS